MERKSRFNQELASNLDTVDHGLDGYDLTSDSLNHDLDAVQLIKYHPDLVFCYI